MVNLEATNTSVGNYGEHGENRSFAGVSTRDVSFNFTGKGLGKLPLSLYSLSLRLCTTTVEYVNSTPDYLTNAFQPTRRVKIKINNGFFY